MSKCILNESILNIHKLIKTKKISSQELTNLCLERLKKVQSLNAYITVCEDYAKESSIQSDERIKKNQFTHTLEGIPIAVKDNFCTKNIKTSCASKTLSNYEPPYDATAVEKLKGSVLIGKTNLDEFAMGCGSLTSFYGPIKNPWKSHISFNVVDKNNDVLYKNESNKDDWYIAGGSSGGSAVAVATGTCFAALASDTGGSTRNPASRVGVIGYKPSYGSISRHGLIPLTHSMDVPGIMTRYVECCEQIFNIVKGKDLSDSTSVKIDIKKSGPFKDEKDFKQIKIGIPEEYNCEGLSDEIKSLWKETADYLENCGAKVEKISLPHSKYSIYCYLVLNTCEVASNFSCYDGIQFGYRTENSNDVDNKLDHYTNTRSESFSDEIKRRIFSGNFFLLKENYDKYFLRAMKIRRLIVNDFKEVFCNKGFDFILTPVTKTEAPKYSEYVDEKNHEKFALEDFCTQAINMAGLPAISLPCKLSKNGLPLSLQLIAPIYEDYKLLEISKFLEKKFQFPQLTLD